MIFQPKWPRNLMNDLENQEGTSSILRQTLCILSEPWVNSNMSYSAETLNSGKKMASFVLWDLQIWWMTFKNNRAPLLYYVKLCPCDLDIWWMTVKNNREPLLCCFKLCASFHSHQWIQTRVAVQKRPIWFKIDDFFSRVTLKFDGWPWKTTGHLSWAISSFVHHFIFICEIKLELWSGNS